MPNWTKTLSDVFRFKFYSFKLQDFNIFHLLEEIKLWDWVIKFTAESLKSNDWRILHFYDKSFDT